MTFSFIMTLFTVLSFIATLGTKTIIKLVVADIVLSIIVAIVYPKIEKIKNNNMTNNHNGLIN